MGCKGSKSAEAPKSEAAGSTLLTKAEEPKGEVPATPGPATETTTKEVVANGPAKKSEEKLNEAPVTQSSAPESTTEVVAANATAIHADESPKEAPAAATTAEADETAETQDPAAPNPDATWTQAKEVEGAGATPEEGSATGLPAQASNEAPTTAPEGTPFAAEAIVQETLAAPDAASKAEVTESPLSLAAANAAVAGKQGGCWGYCTAAEAQSEILVQN